MTKEIKEAARQLQPQLVQWRRWCHQHPGLGFKEHETSEFIAQKLQSWGIEYETGIGQTGVVAIITGDKPGPVIALRADMDALPMQEENTHDFVSKYPGIMHACGHDGHVAIALGAAKLLSERKNQLAGKVVVIFQPAEEGLGGAPAMIKDGVLSRHKVDAIVGGHLGLISQQLSLGQVGVCYGPMMAAAFSFNAKITGKGGHGAMPHQSIDPIVIAAEIITSWQRIITREISPLEPAVLTVARIQGGSSHNIIPEKVELQGTIRYIKPETGDILKTRMIEVLKGIASAWKAGSSFSFNDGYPPVINDKEFTSFFAGLAKELAGEENVIEVEQPTMGGEDMSFFLQEVPGTFFFLGAGNPEKGMVHPHHHPRFDFDEDVLWLGTALLAASAVGYLG